jgi:hypothetical protein
MIYIEELVSLQINWKSKIPRKRHDMVTAHGVELSMAAHHHLHRLLTTQLVAHWYGHGGAYYAGSVRKESCASPLRIAESGRRYGKSRPALADSDCWPRSALRGGVLLSARIGIVLPLLCVRKRRHCCHKKENHKIYNCGCVMTLTDVAGLLAYQPDRDIRVVVTAIHPDPYYPFG